MRHRKNDESECGIVSVPLVIGGTRASVKEFPHMAVIGFGITRKSKLSWDCGGALISDLYILTAAHCMESRELGPAQAVKLGIVDIEDENDLQERDIVEKIPHPRYARASKENDIALIKMDRPVEFTPTVRPACLNNNEIEINRKAFATGFGKLSYDADRGSRYLMKVTLTIYDSPPCAAALKSSFQKFVTETMLCAGEMKGGKDTCQGDSGGPLQIVMKEPYCMYGIIGITSYGKFCGFANSPAVYTKVSSYIPWIESIVWKDN
ncbi:serine protease snake-like, partial [Asbolus verrucosus]